MYGKITGFRGKCYGWKCLLRTMILLSLLSTIYRQFTNMVGVYIYTLYVDGCLYHSFDCYNVFVGRVPQDFTK